MKNFLSIAVDDLNAFAFLKHLYDGTVHTPNIDRLMAMGTTFENGFAQVAVCNPSRTSALSGLYPSETGVHSGSARWYDHVEPSQTLPAVLQAAGYDTSLIGKVFHSTVPEEILPALASFQFNSQENLRAGYRAIGPLAEGEGHGDEINVGVAIDRLEQGGSEPFAMFVGINKPHVNWVVPQAYFDLYPLDEVVVPPYLEDDLLDTAVEAPDSSEVLPDVDPRVAVQGYLAATSYADAMIGRLLDALEATGQIDDTVIALWTDHGYHLGDKDFFGKFTMWEPATRAPFVIAQPGMLDDGQRASQVVELLDVMPTVLDLLEVDTDVHMSGRSLVPFIAAPDLLDDGVAVTTRFGSFSIRTNDWRYIRSDNGETELYDVTDDPYNFNNLSGDPEYALVEAELRIRLSEAALEQNWLLPDAPGVVLGTDADDTFSALDAPSTLIGGAGDDVYFIPSNQAEVIEVAGEGVDLVITRQTYVLPDNVENGYALSTPGIGLTGNALDNQLIGGYQSFGLGGDDHIMLGGAGTAHGGDGDDVIEGFDFGTYNDVLYGGPGNDLLIGHNGDDLLVGGLGDDVLRGGAGRDQVNYAAAANAVQVNLGFQTAFGEGRDTLIGVNDVVGSAFDDAITGSNGANDLYGGAGHDVLKGRAGDDRLFGGAGDDELVGEAGRDAALFSDTFAEAKLTVTSAGRLQVATSEGTDLVHADVEVLVFGHGRDGSESLTLSAQDGRITGGAIVQEGVLHVHAPTSEDGTLGLVRLEGGEGDDELRGPDGVELAGGAGDDAAVFGGTFAAAELRVDEGGRLVVTTSEGTNFVDADVERLVFEQEGLRESLTLSAQDGRITGGAIVQEGVLHVHAPTSEDGTLGLVRLEGGDSVTTYAYTGSALTLTEVFFGGVRTSRLEVAADGDTTETLYTADGATPATVTITDVSDGEAWAVETTLFDAAGLVEARTRTMDSGDVLASTFHADGSMAAQSRIELDDDRFDWLFRPDGSVERDSIFDGGDTRPWERLSNSYDQAGQRTQHERVADDGRTINVYFEDGTTATRTVTQTNGSAVSSSFRPDGSLSSRTHMDAPDLRPWSSYTDSFDFTGTRTGRVMVEDDGDTTETLYTADGVSPATMTITDVSGGEAWAVETTLFDAAGLVEARTRTMDSGDVLASTFHADGSMAAKSRIELDDDQFDWLFRPDGSIESDSILDGGDTRPWERLSNSYDQAGQRTQHERVADDGRTINVYFEDGTTATRTVTQTNGSAASSSFRPDGSLSSRTHTDAPDLRPWSSYTDSFDFTGTRTGRVLVEDDGDRVTTIYRANGTRSERLVEDLSNGAAWSSMTVMFDETGATTGRIFVWDEWDGIL